MYIEKCRPFHAMNLKSCRSQVCFVFGNKFISNSAPPFVFVDLSFLPSHRETLVISKRRR